MSETISEVMDRGSPILKEHLDGASRMHIIQSRRGWCQELLCCVMKSDFRYFVNDRQIAESSEDTSFCCRLCCAPHHSFEMAVMEGNDSETELLEIERPFRPCLMTCKCCCFQQAYISSNDEDLGEIRETWWWCVPQFKIYNDDDEAVYIVHPPTCCGGMCINFWTEGNPCPYGCCKIPCRIYPADAENTNGDAPYVGKILKVPKTSCAQVFHEDQTYSIEFPKDATSDEKSLILGSSLFINALFFEGSE